MRRLRLALLVLFFVPAAVEAQGWIAPPRPDRELGVVKLRTAVAVRVTGRVARVEVEEWFRNDGRPFGEGDYMYPLPGEAVFTNFSLYQGDQELRGETMDAARARGIYEEIVRSKRDPALIELAGHGLLRARVFPFGAGETRKITLRYTQVLERAGDALRFRYAAGAPTTDAAMRPIEQPAQRRGAYAPVSFTLTVESGAEFRDAFSPTHDVRVERENGRMIVRPENALAGDFSVFLPLAEGLVGTTLVTHRPAGEDGYFMLTLSPPQASASRVQRDVAVVLDVSGSMAGEKMQQARAAIVGLLGTLAPADRFRLITFSSGVATFEPEWTPASRAAVERARRWVERLVPEGGTNISAALDEAFRVASADTRLPIVVFLTDGLPTAGETNVERIAQRAERDRGRARVFAFGVGYDVNTHLLDRLVGAGRGATQYIEPGERVEDELGVLAAKIQHPVLTDLRIEDAPVRLSQVMPERLPDLFAGEELIVLGRYAVDGADGTGTIRLSGRRAGEPMRFEAPARFAAHELDNAFVARLWASRRLAQLERQVALGGASAELVEEIRRHALRYGLLSEYTAYLVQEPGIVAMDAAGNRAPPLAAPARAATGSAAVAAAETQRQRREARSMADVSMAEQSAAAQVSPEVAGNAAVRRRLGGRGFELRDNKVWVDTRERRGARVTTIEPFGDAYFALLRAAPELRVYLSAFERLELVGERAVIRIAPGGVERLDAAALAALVRDFRGV